MIKVLVVEDNEMNLELVEHILSSNGMRSINATIGREAIEIVKKIKVDLILMDLQMPEMDGFQTFAAIRENLGANTPPAIAVTGNAMEVDRTRCLEDGFCDFIRKPFRIDTLLTAIRKHLSEESVT